MQTTVYSKLKSQSIARQEIEKNIKEYKNLLDVKTGALKPQVNQDTFKKIRQSLLDSINNVLINRVFPDDILKNLKDIAVQVYRNTRIGTLEHLQSIQVLSNFANNFIINIPDELVLECLEKIKDEFNKIRNLYNQHKLSQKAISEFIKEMNIYLNTNTKNSNQLYDDLKVPVYGLRSDKDNVVKGCIDDIENILNQYLYKFHGVKNKKASKPKEKVVKSSKGFGAGKSLKKIEEQEDIELGFVLENKSNKLKQAVETVLDKKSKKTKQNWVDAVISNVFKRNS